MKRVNVLGEMEYDAEDPEGYRAGVVYVSKALGLRELSIRAFEIPPGESLCPYHYEYVEEWLVVLSGRPSVRVPDGEHDLEPGDAVGFPSGPDGAHKVFNRGEEPARILMFSSGAEPAVAVYPDSDKIGVWSGNSDDKFMLHRRDGAVDYYEGEV